MDHPEIAHLAAIAGALGAVLVLLARGRLVLFGGFALLALAEAGLAGAMSEAVELGDLLSPAPLAIAATAALALAALAWLLVRHPALAPLLLLAAAPFRLPLDLDTSNGFPLEIVTDGQLGRLLPLYFVLSAAVLALLWRTTRDREPRPLPMLLALPAAAFIGFACLSLLWARDLDAGASLIAFFTLPFAALVATVARAPFPEWLPRGLAAVAIGLASLFAAVGIWQQLTHELLFFDPGLELANAKSTYFRVTSLFVDPSLFGRHVALGLGVVLVAFALARLRPAPALGLVGLLWVGLFFSYSQSSMTALVAIVLAVGAATGGRRTRQAVGIAVGVVALALVAFILSASIRGDSLSDETSYRSQRVEDTARVIEERPVAGVGIGSQPRVSRDLSGRDRPVPDFVSHTTPLTVAAELGAVGLLLYMVLLGAGAVLMAAVHRRDRALGLGLGVAFLGLFVHSLSYSGFLEDPITWILLALAGGYLGSRAVPKAVVAQAERPAGTPRSVGLAR